MQIIRKIGVDFLDGVGKARVERHRDHRTDFGEVDVHHGVVVGSRAGSKPAIGLAPPVDVVPALRAVIGLPDGAEAGRLCCHDVDADAEIHGQIRDAGADKFKHLVFDKAALEYGADQGERHILRADAADGRAGQVDRHHLRIADVIGLAEQLLDKLRAALSHRHGAERAVAGVGIRAEDHCAAFCQHFAGKLVDDREVRRDIHAAVLFRGGEAEDMIVLIDRPAHGTQ